MYFWTRNTKILLSVHWFVDRDKSIWCSANAHKKECKHRSPQFRLFSFSIISPLQKYIYCFVCLCNLSTNCRIVNCSSLCNTNMSFNFLFRPFNIRASIHDPFCKSKKSYRYQMYQSHALILLIRRSTVDSKDGHITFTLNIRSLYGV